MRLIPKKHPNAPYWLNALIGLITRETRHEAYWYLNFNPCILVVVKHLELEAYGYMRGQEGLVVDVGAPTKEGNIFYSPLSNGSCKFNVAALRSYVNNELSHIDRSRCEAMTRVFHYNSLVPKIGLALSKLTIKESYGSVRDYMLRPDSKEVFCRQLSDQLTLCEGCFERPILYNVIKNEEAMQNHIKNHNYGGWARDELYQMLMSTLPETPVWSNQRSPTSETRASRAAEDLFRHLDDNVWP